MKTNRIIPLVIFVLLACGKVFGQLEKIKYVNTFIDSLSSDSSFYNVFKFQRKFILLKDNRAFNGVGGEAEDYVKSWGSNSKPAETINFFLLDGELKKLKRSERKFLRGLGLTNATFKAQDYMGFRQGLIASNLEQTQQEFIAIIYECTDNHEGKPHSGTDDNELRTKFGCSKFKVKIL